jgi:hypothetical protein
MELHILQDPSALCLDGTPGAFYFARGASASKWMVWHEGKAWCLSEEDCVKRANATDGRGGWSASGWPSKPGCLPPTIPFAGKPEIEDTAQLSPMSKSNPTFHDFNMVFVKTCDGGSWSGNQPRVSPGGLYYRGASILKATIDALVEMGIENATEIVIGGGSAGALGVYRHVNYYVERLNPVGLKRVVALPDCGFFQDLGFQNKYYQGMSWMKSEDGMAAIVDPYCAARHSQDLVKCLFAEHVAPFIKVPIFALQAMYDKWQIENILSNVANHSPKGMGRINAFGENIKKKLLSSVLDRKVNAVFLDGCEHHCGGFNTYHVDNLTQSLAVDIWYKYGSGALPYQGRIFANVDFPCSACCVTFKKIIS